MDRIKTEVYGLKIHDGVVMDNVEVLDVSLLDILNVIEGGAELNWSIIELEAVWNPDAGESSISEEEILALPRGLRLSFDELKIRASKIYQAINAVFIGCKSSEALVSYDSLKKMYAACDLVIELVDSGFCRIHSPDASQIKRLTMAFKNTKRLYKYIRADEALPVPKWDNFFAVMTAAYLNGGSCTAFGSGNQYITTFDALFAQLGLEPSAANLPDILTDERVCKAAHRFPAEIIRIFKEGAGRANYVGVQHQQTGRYWKREYADFFEREDFFASTIKPYPFGVAIAGYEGFFRMASKHHDWYGILHTASPIVIFSVNAAIAAQLSKYAAATAMALSPQLVLLDAETLRESFSFEFL